MELQTGHRHRLRERFLKTYSDGMHDYEVLELLLTYAIPRRDVKPLAKQLMNCFGGLSGVLDASPAELRDRGEVGPATIVLLRLIKEMGALYLKGRLEKRDILTSPERVVQFASMKLAGLPHEAFMAIFLNTQNEIIDHAILNEGTIDHVAVYPRRIVEQALERHAAALIIVHNHPSGHTDPSEDDQRLTRSIRDAAKWLDIRLLDHLIVSRAAISAF